MLVKANGLRETKLQEELAVMEPLTASRVPAFTTERVRVTTWSTIRVKKNTYSVPSRLIGEEVVVRVYEDRIEVRYRGVLQLTTERLLGRNGHRVVSCPTEFAQSHPNQSSRSPSRDDAFHGVPAQQCRQPGT